MRLGCSVFYLHYLSLQFSNDFLIGPIIRQSFMESSVSFSFVRLYYWCNCCCKIMSVEMLQQQGPTPHNVYITGMPYHKGFTRRFVAMVMWKETLNWLFCTRLEYNGFKGYDWLYYRMIYSVFLDLVNFSMNCSIFFPLNFNLASNKNTESRVWVQKTETKPSFPKGPLIFHFPSCGIIILIHYSIPCI